MMCRRFMVAVIWLPMYLLMLCLRTKKQKQLHVLWSSSTVVNSPVSRRFMVVEMLPRHQQPRSPSMVLMRLTNCSVVVTVRTTTRLVQRTTRTRVLTWVTTTIPRFINRETLAIPMSRPMAPAQRATRTRPLKMQMRPVRT